MATFILVHGSWHGGWCWYKIAPLLEAAGHIVLAPDLPGHGDDYPSALARPYEYYIPFIRDILETQPARVILVGHSSGGMLISAVAEQCPEKIAALVYLSAFLLPPGVTPSEMMREDRESILAASLDIDTEHGISTVRPEYARAVFYADCNEDEAAWATSCLVPEPLIPRGMGMPAEAREAIVAPPPRVYIETRQDKALGPATQRRMYMAMACEKVFSFDTSHSPFLSAPAPLAAHLGEIATAYAPGT